MKQIDGVGELTVDESIPEWLVSQKIDVPWWPGAKLRFVFPDLDDDARPSDFASAVTRFLALTQLDRDHAASYVLANYKEACDAVDGGDVGVTIQNAADVWQHVHLDEVFVRRRSSDGRVYVQLMAECRWDAEHGLQIVFRDGRELSRVSQQDDHLTYADAHGLPDSHDRIG
jgi:hypothetical protein